MASSRSDLRRPKQCTDKSISTTEKCTPFTRLKPNFPVPCRIAGCRWVGDVSLLESHLKQRHGECTLKQVERSSEQCTHYLLAKEYADKVESIRDVVEQCEADIKQLDERKFQQERELSKAEQIERKCKIRRRSFDLQPGTKHQSAHCNDDLTQACIVRKRCYDEVEKTKEKIAEVQDMLVTYQMKLQTLQSNSSSFEHPVQVFDQSNVLSGSNMKHSAAPSIESLSQASSSRALHQRSLTSNSGRSDHDQVYPIHQGTPVPRTPASLVQGGGDTISRIRENEAISYINLRDDQPPCNDSKATVRLPILSEARESSQSAAMPIQPQFRSLPSRRNTVTLPYLTESTIDTANIRSSLARPFSSSGHRKHLSAPKLVPTPPQSNSQASAARPRHRKLRRSSSERVPRVNVESNDCQNCVVLSSELRYLKEKLTSKTQSSQP